ncbi:MAG: DUF2066 domain-containing protein [Alphaproteobacteria bacterium]
MAPRLLLVALLFLSPTAWAQQDIPLTSPGAPIPAVAAPPRIATVSEAETDIYMVENTAVDVTASSAAAARDKAIFDAQRAALGQLLTRLGADQGVDPGSLSNSKLAAMVQDFEITQEKASTVRYIATLNVRFKPNAVQNFLGSSGVNYTTTPSKPVVILPVSTSNGRAVLWEERTAWRTACEALARPDPILPILVPSGDLKDISVIRANDALTGDDGALNAVVANYAAGTVVVAHIAVETEKLNPARSLAVSVSRYDDIGQRLGSDLLNIPPAATLEAQLAAAAQAVEKLIRKYWRESNGLDRTANSELDAVVPQSYTGTIQTGSQTSLPVEAAISGLNELTLLRKKLSRVTPIHTTEVVSLMQGVVNLRLGFNGDIIGLQQALAGQGLTLEQLPSGYWHLRSH